MATLFQILLIPLTLLNLLGGIVSGVWLIILGDWWPIGYGLAGLFLSSYLLAFAMMPSLLMMAPAILLFERGKPLLAIPLLVFANTYTVMLLSGWCILIFWLFMSRGNDDNFIPLLLWSYGVALGPWMYMAQKESRGGSGQGETILVFFGQIAYIIIALVVTFAGGRLQDLAMIFGIVMIVGLLTLLTLAMLMLRDSRNSSW